MNKFFKDNIKYILQSLVVLLSVLMSFYIDSIRVENQNANYKNEMLVVLTGIMLGSLNKVWPWKQTISTYVNSHGVSKPLLEQSISPYSFNGDAQLTMAIVAAIIGFAIILVMEKLAVHKNK